MAAIDPSKYEHSPVHKAVLERNYDALRSLLEELPRLGDPYRITTEAESLAEEEKADAIAAVIDRRDVPNGETPLYIAVRLGDATAVEMLMVAGADWTLKNEQRWSAFQEAVCSGKKNLARIIIRHSNNTARWVRRLPRVIASMRRMRDLYMEINFHFESSVIPFVSRIAPSDTYKIWKRGANMRADMTMAGFDGFRIQRADQSVLFIGDGADDKRLPAGSMCIISHKKKEVVYTADRDEKKPAKEGGGAAAAAATGPTQKEFDREVAAMSDFSFRPRLNVTQAILLPQVTWTGQERSEMVGPWKAKVYDMHNVVLCFKPRRPPARSVTAVTKEKDLSPTSSTSSTSPTSPTSPTSSTSSKSATSAASSSSDSESSNSDEFEDALTEEEHKQLEEALEMEVPPTAEQVHSESIACHRHTSSEPAPMIAADEDVSIVGTTSKGSGRKHERKKSGRSKKKEVPPRSNADEKHDKIPVSHSAKVTTEDPGKEKGKEPRRSYSSSANSDGECKNKQRNKERGEVKKFFRPVLWLSPDFPLGTDDLQPLLDILAHKVKAICRLRELLTTKLPAGTFPVKVAIPVVPTIRVLVTFTKFVELPPLEGSSAQQDGSKNSGESQGSGSWSSWIKAPYRQLAGGASNSAEGLQLQDPFAIPQDYTWITFEASRERKKKKMQENRNTQRKGKNPQSRP